MRFNTLIIQPPFIRILCQIHTVGYVITTLLWNAGKSYYALEDCRFTRLLKIQTSYSLYQLKKRHDSASDFESISVIIANFLASKGFSPGYTKLNFGSNRHRTCKFKLLPLNLILAHPTGFRYPTRKQDEDEKLS